MVRHHTLKGFYDIERTVGCGGFAKVKLATHIATGDKVAIKIMIKSQLGDDLKRVKLELEALKTFCHEHICKLYQVIETETHFFIVMEYCSGGELFDHIVEKNRLSESESRMFFRQIVSAVAYLHSLGYAHRDLKPENVLLDKNQNLKLIDFGLCARPAGGMQNPLFTSCGSPTYAAPELVLGKQYLGPEVDVWSMGVLLYALLSGSLPFDDLNIDNLYKKILSGKYEEPPFISKDSRLLIRSMLQVDPKKRIKVSQLLNHPWLTLGILDDVHVKSAYLKMHDSDCVNVMADHYRVEPTVMWTYLKKWKYDYHTATYFLLLARKRQGSVLKLGGGVCRLPFGDHDRSNGKSITALKSIENSANLQKPNDHLTAILTPPPAFSQILTPNKQGDTSSPCTPKTQVFGGADDGFTEPKRPVSTRKPVKRFRSPTLDDNSSPIPTKKSTPGKHHTPVKTPDRNSETPGSAKRVLGSIERSLYKVKHVLTPRKVVDTPGQPVYLNNKNLCNVSTTQCKDPELVICELSKALEKKGIICTRKGFTLKGSLEPNAIHRLGGCSFELEICYLPNIGLPTAPNQNALTPAKSILKKGILNTPSSDNQTSNSGANKTSNGGAIQTSNEGAIQISNGGANQTSNGGGNVNSGPSETSPCVGIKRKRLKGDSWCYKNVCEQVLALTCTGFRQVTESAV